MVWRLVSNMVTRSRSAGRRLPGGKRPERMDRDRVARDLETSVSGVTGVHHMHVWSMDGSRNMATLHACLAEGTDAHGAITAIKQRLAASHGIGHATVEVEFGACADGEAAHSH